MKNGTRPTKLSHKDYDFLKSHKLSGTLPIFSDEYFADAGLTMPNQNAIDTEYNPPTPIMPEGCTNFAQADIATDLTRTAHNPNDLEAVTHANALGGIDIRTSLDACTPKRLGWFMQYFNIRSNGRIDWFDCMRLAQLVGVDAGEHRAITWATPWFPSWESAAQRGESIMPMPMDTELAAIRADEDAFPWHNSVLDGFSNRLSVAPGRDLYRDKSWQGNEVGDRGFVYFPREVINMVMGIRGTAAYTPTNEPVDNPMTIDLSTLQWLVSVLRSLLSRYLS